MIRVQVAFCVLLFVLTDGVVGFDTEKDYSEWGLSKDEVAKLKEIFDDIDNNRDGKISKEELCAAVGKRKKTLTEEQLDFWLDAADYDEDGSVGLEDFLMRAAVYKEAKIEDQLLHETFDDIDTNKDGFISPNELIQYLATLGEKVADDQIDEIIFPADTDKDGMVNFQEFKRMIYIMELLRYYEELEDDEDFDFDECDDSDEYDDEECEENKPTENA